MSHIASEGAAIALAYVLLFYVDAINNARIWSLRKNETSSDAREIAVSGQRLNDANEQLLSAWRSLTPPKYVSSGYIWR